MSVGAAPLHQPGVSLPEPCAELLSEASGGAAMSAPRPSGGLVLLAILGGSMVAAEARASLTYSNPFHPEQCALAVGAAVRACWARTV